MRNTANQTWSEYAAKEGVTPLCPYVDIIDHLIEFYSMKRPHASLEELEAWADAHAERYAE